MNKLESCCRGRNPGNAPQFWPWLSRHWGRECVYCSNNDYRILEEIYTDETIQGNNAQRPSGPQDHCNKGTNHRSVRKGLHEMTIPKAGGQRPDCVAVSTPKGLWSYDLSMVRSYWKQFARGWSCCYKRTWRGKDNTTFTNFAWKCKRAVVTNTEDQHIPAGRLIAQEVRSGTCWPSWRVLFGPRFMKHLKD